MKQLTSILFHTTKYIALIAFLLVSIITFALEMYVVMFTTVLLVVGTILSFSGALFTYFSDSEPKIKKAVSISSTGYLASSVWLSMGSMVLFLEVILRSANMNFLHTTIVQFILIAISLLNLIVGVRILDRALTNTFKVLYH